MKKYLLKLRRADITEEELLCAEIYVEDLVKCVEEGQKIQKMKAFSFRTIILIKELK